MGKHKKREKLTNYEQNINSLIPAAEKEALTKVRAWGGKRFEKRPGADGRTYSHCFFTEFFHKAMVRLAVEKGFRSF